MPTFMDNSQINSKSLNLKRELIGNDRQKVMEKFLEPHNMDTDDRNMFKDLDKTRPTKIDLSFNEIRDSEFESQNFVLLKGLTDINLEGNKLGCRAVERLVDYMSTNTKVKSLNLENNTISDRYVADIVDILKQNSCIQILRLGNNCLADKTAESIGNLMTTNKTLGQLGLCWGKLRQQHLNIILKSLCNDTNCLRFLDLSYNSIGIEDSQINSNQDHQFNSIVQIEKLNHLNLSYNGLNADQCSNIGLKLAKNSSIVGFHSEGNALVLDAWGYSHDDLEIQMENFKMK